MTPKEKAEELVAKFQQDVYIQIHGQMSINAAKKCARIAVGEVLKTTVLGNLSGPEAEKEAYWQTVLKCIDNL